ncbi:uncharacterized protein [Nicotiana sylvestris]|uniref:uncharacterized protein n=1 Tax=Nicotiana sylvestris TaxID=4096 RepID=UPI00388C925A
MTAPSSLVDIDEELIERFQRFFDDVNMVEVGEGLSTDLVVYKLPIDPAFPPVKQKLRKFKTDMSVKIKEEVTEHLEAKTDECQEAFDKIKGYLSNPHVLVLPELGRPLIIYLIILDNSFGYVMGQHDITGRKEQGIYYFSKKFTSYEVEHTPLERTCCSLTWVAHKLKHYLSSYTTYLISYLDPLKYIIQKLMPTGRLAKWQILLTEFDIIYVTRTAMKAQALANHLAENPVDEEYEPWKTYFPDEEVMHVDKVDKEENTSWKLFIDGAANIKEFGHIPRIHNEVADALATLASILHHPDKAYIDSLHIQVRDQHAYYNVTEEELDGEPWFHDIREYIRMGVYPVQATRDQKRTIHHLASGFFFSGGVFYKRTLDLGLLRCIDARQATTIMTEVHFGVCGLNMSGYVLAKKIL